MKSFAALAFYVLAVGLTDALDPDTVPLSLRSNWCTSQRSQCPLLCLQYPGDNAGTISNTCDPRSLSWSCVCSVNGLSPNVTEYSLTIPYFICTETNNQCKKNCGNGDGSCAHQCEVSNLCGARNPTRVNTSTISSTMSSTASNSKPTGGDDDYSSFGSGGSGSSGSNNGGDGGENGGGVDGTGAASGLKVDGSMAGMAALVAAVGLGFGALL